jgi:serine/threonine-protein kinase
MGDPMIGETVSGYQIARKLGEGATGDVYCGERGDGRVTVKVLRPELCMNRELLNRFFSEARAVQALAHPGLARIRDHGVHAGGRGFVITEYLQGESLDMRLEREVPLADVGTILQIARQVAGALDVAHQAKIVHRNLKPSNVFLLSDETASGPTVKLLDFGVARLRLPGQVATAQTGSAGGMPLYMAPEEGRGAEKVDHRADIYSLGCILFEMACGRPPFIRESTVDLIIAHVSEAPPTPSRIRPDLAPAIDQIVTRMMAKDPGDRPQSMAEVAILIGDHFAPVGPTIEPLPATVVRPLTTPVAAAARLGGETMRLPDEPPGPSGDHPVIGGTRLLPATSAAGTSRPIGVGRGRRMPPPVRPIPTGAAAAAIIAVLGVAGGVATWSLVIRQPPASSLASPEPAEPMPLEPIRIGPREDSTSGRAAPLPPPRIRPEEASTTMRPVSRPQRQVRRPVQRRLARPPPSAPQSVEQRPPPAPPTRPRSANNAAIIE